MPNGHDYSKEYGPHKYPNVGRTVHCEHGCDCWIGASRSGGPIGIEPAPYGECPANPRDGELVGGNADHEIVVTRRIQRLESELYSIKIRAEKAEALVGSSNLSLSEELGKALRREAELKTQLLKIKEMATLTSVNDANPED